MKRFANLKYIALFALLIAVPFVAGAYTESAAAHEGEDHSQEAVQAQAEKSYEYTAQPGDTYSQMARKAVQTYGVNNKVNLSQAQIIFAETNLTIEAGSPFLNQGQKVALKEATVKSWVEKAGKLTDAQKKAWQVYTVGVDFNTDNIGEKR